MGRKDFHHSCRSTLESGPFVRVLGTYVRFIDRCKKAILVILLVPLFAACGEYSGDSSGSGEANGPSIYEPPPGVSLAEQVAAFKTTVYPVLTQRCANGCHDTGRRGSPFLFANSDVESAHEILTESQKVNLDDPPQSRIVKRPTVELHECGRLCAQIGSEMLSAAEAWAAIYDQSMGPGPPP